MDKIQKPSKSVYYFCCKLVSLHFMLRNQSVEVPQCITPKPYCLCSDSSTDITARVSPHETVSMSCLRSCDIVVSYTISELYGTAVSRYTPHHVTSSRLLM
jgi:hypothetical protein